MSLEVTSAHIHQIAGRLSPGFTSGVGDLSPGCYLILDDALKVVAASAAFCRAFEIEASEAVGLSSFGLGNGAWDIPQLRQMLEGILAGGSPAEPLRFYLAGSGAITRCLAAQAQRLIDADPRIVRLIVSVTDITDALAGQLLWDDIHESQTLLVREVRHRVTNSLQIVASILLLNARKTQAEEAREHLQAAYGRVMAVAALERQLSEATDDLVDLGDYLFHLCAHMSEAAIPDRDRVSLRCFVDPVVVSSSTAASLGMIVTEVIINALKHAFPGERRGNVTVAYDMRGGDWVLSIGDNGVGMPNSPGSGLGTEIVQALARQLQASVAVSDGFPGTITSVSYSAARPL